MAEEKKNIPKLRFREFTGDNANAWELRKLGDIGSVAMNKRVFKHQTSDNGEIPFFKIGTFGGKADTFISRKLFEEYKRKYPYPNKGDILLSASGSIGKIVVYTGEDEYFQDSNIVWFKHDGKINNQFLKQFYTIVKWDGLEGSTIKRLYNKNILNTNILLPAIREQEKIGTFFKHLDSLITLHQRMLDEYKTLKKTMLSKIFPKNGEKYPELRFFGFTDAWELRKLGLLASFTKGNGYSKKDLVQDSNQTPIILYGSLYTNYKTNIEKVDTFARVKDKTIYSSGNDVVVPASGESAEDISRASAILKKGIILGGDLNIIHPLPDLNAIFLAITISNGTQKRELSRRAQGKSVVHLRNQDLKQVNLLYPNLEEQQKIGSFFKHLDELITLHQRELELLKTLKKTMLQQMFV